MLKTINEGFCYRIRILNHVIRCQRLRFDEPSKVLSRGPTLLYSVPELVICQCFAIISFKVDFLPLVYLVLHPLAIVLIIVGSYEGRLILIIPES